MLFFVACCCVFSRRHARLIARVAAAGASCASAALCVRGVDAGAACAAQWAPGLRAKRLGAPAAAASQRARTVGASAACAATRAPAQHAAPSGVRRVPARRRGCLGAAPRQRSLPPRKQLRKQRRWPEQPSQPSPTHLWKRTETTTHDCCVGTQCNYFWSVPSTQNTNNRTKKPINWLGVPHISHGRPCRLFFCPHVHHCAAGWRPSVPGCKWCWVSRRRQ